MNVHKARLSAFDSRINQLEHAFNQAERNLRTFEKSREKTRTHLTHDEQHALVQKVYYQQLDRIAEHEARRQESLAEEARASPTRWVNNNRLDAEQLELVTSRLYDDQVAAAQQRRQHLAETYITETSPTRCIERDDLQLAIQRLYNTEVAVRNDKRTALRAKHLATPPSRVLTPALCTEQTSRLYTGGMKRSRDATAALQKKYVETSELPRVKLGVAQQAKMIERLYR